MFCALIDIPTNHFSPKFYSFQTFCILPCYLRVRTIKGTSGRGSGWHAEVFGNQPRRRPIAHNSVQKSLHAESTLLRQLPTMWVVLIFNLCMNAVIVCSTVYSGARLEIPYGILPLHYLSIVCTAEHRQHQWQCIISPSSVCGSSSWWCASTASNAPVHSSAVTWLSLKETCFNQDKIVTNWPRPSFPLVMLTLSL